MADHHHVLAGVREVDGFEAISENYMDTGGRPLAILEAVRRDYPVALHGVALSIGSMDPLDETYLSALSRLIERIEPAIVSDHLCFSSYGGRQLHDLLPMPLAEEALDHVIERIRRVQDVLGRRILLENPSTYLAWKSSIIPEAEFLFDTHSRPVSDEVWDLYAHAFSRIRPCSTMVEWDADIPPWSHLAQEVEQAREIAEAVANREEPLRGVLRSSAASTRTDCVGEVQ